MKAWLRKSRRVDLLPFLMMFGMMAIAVITAMVCVHLDRADRAARVRHVESLGYKVIRSTVSYGQSIPAGSGCVQREVIVHFEGFDSSGRQVEGEACCDRNECKMMKVFPQ